MNTPDSASEKPVIHLLAHRQLVEPVLWEQLVDLFVKDMLVDRSLIEQILDQTIAFLKLRAIDPKGCYRASSLVAHGCRIFICFTEEYAAFCKRVAGCFMHFNPVLDSSDCPTEIARTVSALKKHKLTVDETWWTGQSASCGTSCGNCGNGENGGNQCCSNC